MNSKPYPHGLSCALCALSFFKRRHGYYEPHSRRALARMEKRRNLNNAASYRQLALSYIRQARAAGFRGSIIAAVQSHHRTAQ